jgi:hypothetical protein
VRWWPVARSLRVPAGRGLRATGRITLLAEALLGRAR